MRPKTDTLFGPQARKGPEGWSTAEQEFERVRVKYRTECNADG